MKRYILCSVFFSPPNGVIYEIMLENVVELDRPHMTIQYNTEKDAVFMLDN
jgi:hypothetical protein